MAGVEPVFMAGAIVSGAAFGDNLGPISDTTIASATTQNADLGNVVKTRMKYSIPAAVLALILFVVFTRTHTNGIAIEGAAEVVSKPVSLVILLVPATIIALCLMRKHLVVSLSYGVIAGIVVSLIFGVYKLSDLLHFPGGFSVQGHFITGITGTMNTVAMLIAVFALLGVLEASGLFKSIGDGLSKIAKGPSSGEAAIICSIGILSMLTGVISVAIVAMGDIVATIGDKVGLDKYRRANLMDCTGIIFCFLAPWTVHCVIPAAQTAAFGEAAAVVPASVPLVNFYAISMAVVLILMVITGYGRVSKVTEPEDAS
jgi:Na+/H+ antiporter NhaC